MTELTEADLLMDGEVAIQQADQSEQPYVYRGFRMVNQEKLRELDAEKIKQWNASGLLPMVYAHLFSLDLMRVIFAKQVQQGKGPVAIKA
jgi:hypothetical protein